MSDLLHAFFAFLLFFEQFALARYVAAIALCKDVFAHGFYVHADYYFFAYCGLYRHFEKLAGDKLFQSAYNGVPSVVRLIGMAYEGKSVYRLFLQQHVDLYEV